jgi:hypothetical protein
LWSIDGAAISLSRDRLGEDDIGVGVLTDPLSLRVGA